MLGGDSGGGAKRNSANPSFRSSYRAFPKSGTGGERRRQFDWNDPREQSKGSTAWMDIQEEGQDQGQRPVWKNKGKKEKRSNQSQRKRPLPKGVDRKLLSLGIEDLEARLKGKFSGISEKSFSEGGNAGASDADDTSMDFYDEDDDGYEGVRGNAGAGGVKQGAAAPGKKDPAMWMKRQEAVKAGAAGAATAGSEVAAEVMDEGEPVKVTLQGEEEAVKRSSHQEVAAREAFRMRPRAESPQEPEEGDEAQEHKDAAAKSKPERVADKIEYLSHISIANMKQQEVLSVEGFNDLGVTSQPLLDQLDKMGITKPTHVQAEALAALLGQEENDVILHAHTGSGKTLAFLLPLLERIDPSIDSIQAVVVAPGRELGSQIFGVAQQLVENMGIRCQMVLGGANVNRQVERVKKLKPQVLIGTPGRICELALQRKRVKLSNVSFLVLDEIDSLMRHPYCDEIANIVDTMPSSDRRQTIFASATGKSKAVTDAAERFMSPGYTIASDASGRGQDSGLPTNLQHCILTQSRVKKYETFKRFLNTQPFPESLMVFVNDPHQVNWLTEKLEGSGIVAAPLSGKSEKDDRSEIMKRLQDGRLGMVVTTEMAARGIDVPTLTHVVNYDLPTDAEHYVHRAGRCGRAGKPGVIVNLVTPDTKFVMSKFKQRLGLQFVDAAIQGSKLWEVRRVKAAEAKAEAPAKKPKRSRETRVEDKADEADEAGVSKEAGSWAEVGGDVASEKDVEVAVNEMEGMLKKAGVVGKEIAEEPKVEVAVTAGAGLVDDSELLDKPKKKHWRVRQREARQALEREAKIREAAAAGEAEV
ncbi:unnamed protein product [Chrysoparadoxa australica]